ncbi:GNAT family N-acetyltransferase [Microbacterium betulae]|uniref:GNAT family N-acetyltransferase n=1 Tax=Microbacterium betulae TaxID=2981139 RepID=A0AA97I6Z5_9MICO|nr:GNAT family N-acetyltransferase [Microbacterium sp. AB]WOF23682.1 GNAT family N-acetyltransferase [Microbacterium sp. AB]
MTSVIRPYRPADRAALGDVCVRTADAGGDATGLLSDDGLWPALFFFPYADRHPDLAFTVETDGRAAGYLVCAPDTVAFETWFLDEWWPAHAERFPHPGDATGREADLLRYASGRGRETPPYVAGHPAHLHIDLLPGAQGQGVGRRLIGLLQDALRERGVPGVHLGADPANAGALVFYERLGFTRLPGEGSAVFVRSLR